MKVIVLLSGGIDSTVVLASALATGRECLAISFDYGQKHIIELEHARDIAKHYDVKHAIIQIGRNCFGNSSLTSTKKVPKNRTTEEIIHSQIPSTYVPARNTLFLAYAIGQAEIHNAQEIYAGPNILDRNAYPDCRPEFYQAFQQVATFATKQAVEGNPPRIVTPLIDLNKKEIVSEGKKLNIPFDLTFSCYDPTPEGKPCHQCDACILRAEALQSNFKFC
ncbi:MAG: 7-cyano-7-deazaguanine synthase [Chlamydiae bacterium]|nr:7-cyano-7-deazaguanine synthase [Chlamydiota bacterium]